MVHAVVCRRDNARAPRPPLVARRALTPAAGGGVQARQRAGPATQLRRGPDIPAGLCVRGLPTSSGAAIPLGREPRNGTEWTIVPPHIRAAQTRVSRPVGG